MKYNYIPIIIIILLILFFKKNNNNKELFQEIISQNINDFKSSDPRYKDFHNFTWRRWNTKNNTGWFDSNEPKIYRYKKIWPD